MLIPGVNLKKGCFKFLKIAYIGRSIDDREKLGCSTDEDLRNDVFRLAAVIRF